MVTTLPTDAPQPNVDQLVARVAEIERTQLAEDVEGFAALFDDDAVWVTGGGVRLVGRDAIAAFTARALPGAFRAGSVRYVVTYVHVLSPQLALTGVDQEYLDTDGRRLSPRQEGRPTYLWRRSGETWRIVAGQNTVVPPPDEADSP